MPHLEAVHTKPLRSDVWSASNPHVLSRYRIYAEAEPDLICRVLNLFAMQYLIPQQVSVSQEDSMLMIEAQVGGMTWHRAQVIGEKMRNLISVCSVELEPVSDLYPLAGAASMARG